MKARKHQSHVTPCNCAGGRFGVFRTETAYAVKDKQQRGKTVMTTDDRLAAHDAAHRMNDEASTA